MSAKTVSRHAWCANALFVLLLLLMIIPYSSVRAEQGAGSMYLTAEQTTKTIYVPLHKSRIIPIQGSVKKVSVGNPEVADILVVGTQQLYILGKHIGTTNLLVWDKSSRLVSTMDVEVTHDLDGLKTKIHELFPGENIEVRSAQGTLVLSGHISAATVMDASMQLARSYALAGVTDKEKQGGEASVINLMQVSGAHQVMLEVKVAEMARSLMRRLNVDFSAINSDVPWTVGAVNGGATFPDALTADDLRVPVFGDLSGDKALIGPMVKEFLPNLPGVADKGLFASYLSSNFMFNMALNAAKERGLARILAEPTLTAITGQEAQFLSGGEFPIPVPNGSNGITIEFKEFGVGLKFLPVVLNTGHISLKLNISVSELTAPNSVMITSNDTPSEFLIPALTKRSAMSTVELSDGQTIGIAGLISERLRGVVNKFPGLGEIPVLGTLFRSQEYENGQTELVIFVTPRLARPIEEKDIRLPTDGFVEASDSEFYLLGKMEGKSPASNDGMEAGAVDTTFGHDLQ